MADEAAVRQAVRAHKTWGAAAMKVWYIMPPQPPDTTRVSNLMRVAGDEARKVGLPLIVHATGLWEAKDALRAGARVLVHSVWSAPVDDEFLDLARRRGTTYVPTLTVPDGYRQVAARRFARDRQPLACVDPTTRAKRSEEHTSEPQSRLHLVCRLLLEKKKSLATPPVLRLPGCRHYILRAPSLHVFALPKAWLGSSASHLAADHPAIRARRPAAGDTPP